MHRHKYITIATMLTIGLIIAIIIGATVWYFHNHTRKSSYTTDNCLISFMFSDNPDPNIIIPTFNTTKILQDKQEEMICKHTVRQFCNMSYFCSEHRKSSIKLHVDNFAASYHKFE